jgi:hypothetical protein
MTIIKIALLSIHFVPSDVTVPPAGNFFIFFLLFSQKRKKGSEQNACQVRVRGKQR